MFHCIFSALPPYELTKLVPMCLCLAVFLAATAGESEDVTLPEAGDGNSPVPSLALTAGDYGYQNNDDTATSRSTLLR